MTITDAQLHIWEADRPDRPWDRAHKPQLPEPFTLDRVIALLDGEGIDRAVLVPPLVSGFNSDSANAYALDAAAAYPERLAVVGRFDPRPPEARERLASWLEQPGMRGVRLSLEGPPAPQLLEEGHLDWFWPEAERLGVPVYIVRPGRPQDLADIAARHPALRISCDHLALPRERGPEVLSVHIDRLATLVPHANVIIKVSSLPSMSHQGYPFADLHDSVRQIFDLFGPSRLAWATDITALRGRLGDSVTYAQARDFVQAALPNLSAADRAQIFDGTIARFLDWPSTS